MERFRDRNSLETATAEARSTVSAYALEADHRRIIPDKQKFRS